MKANEVNLLNFLKKSPQFIIPIYQRTYSWTQSECQQLWNDIIRTGSDDQIKTHFVGSIVYIEQGQYQVSLQSPLLVIDGQQRLTTISLILEALARKIPDGEEPVGGLSTRKIRNYYLLNPNEEGDHRYKMLLTQTDKQTFLSLVEQKTPPADSSLRITENFAFFDKQIANSKDSLEQLCKGLAKLMIVDIALTREHDNPQLIFESMNSTGKDLSQADLIRNFILMGLKPNLQTQLYEDYWHPMETAFGQEAYGKHFDGFMRHYLTVKTDEIPRVHDVYKVFRNYAGSPEVKKKDVDSLLSDLHKFANYYCAIALNKEEDSKLATAFADLRELKVDVAYPLLLTLYDDYKKEILSRENFALAVRWIESYVFRRAVCEIPTNSMNKTFAAFAKFLKKDKYLENIAANFLLLPSYRRFPNDDEFRRDLMKRDLYNFRNRSHWLRRLENHDRKEHVPVGEYTIEHIMPQNKDLSTKWREALGNDWKHIQETYLHTLGNLTLTKYNSEYSDNEFAKKRDMLGGFRQSPLHLNEGLGQLENWNKSEILKRADRLAQKATDVWTIPVLEPDTLNKYRPDKEKKQTTYTIKDHPFLTKNNDIFRLFDIFSKRVLALDPCVTEEILKLYIAYKAESNFVDVVPRAKRLLLSLNMDFHELHDPKRIAKDVTNLGRWGNGNIEISLDSEKEILYVMSLVRQSFEKQIGDEAVDA